MKISTGVNYKTSSRNEFRENQYRIYLQNIQQKWDSWKSVQELLTKHPAGMSFVKIALVTVTLYSRHQLHFYPHCPHFLTRKCQIRQRRSICNFVKPLWILCKSVQWNPNFIILNGVNRTLTCFQNFSPGFGRVGTDIRLRATHKLEIVVRFPADEENFSLLQNIQASSWTQLASCLTLRRLMSYIYIWSTHSWCF